MSQKDNARLVLFDIDGTLLSTGGAGRRAMKEALVEVYGTCGSADGFPFGGKTDPQIVSELLLQEGLSEEFIQNNLSLFFTKYIQRLRQQLCRTQLKLYPGVKQLLSTLAETEGVFLGLLTGNIREGAWIKLRAFQLGRYFQTGAYGDDSPDRYELPRIAVERASKQFKKEFQGRDVVIIGDTLHDIRCASSIGARTIAVATGWTPLTQLRKHKPDFLFPDFSDYQEVVKAITAK